MSYSDPDRCDVLLIGFEGQENLGVRSIAAFLMQAGVRVDIVPLQSTTPERMLTQVRARRPKLIGLSLIFQRMLDDFGALIAYLRGHGVTAHITVGGHFPTFEFAHMLSTIPGLDTVVRHEGEETLLELFRNLERPESWFEIRGLAFRHGGRVHASPVRPLIRDLDTLPVPLRTPHGATHRGIGIRSIAGSRGCYYDCSFCSIHEFYARSPGQNRRTRSPEHVVGEMEALFRDFGVQIFIFQDDDLFMRGRKHREWLERFLTGLEERGLGKRILWRVSCRVDDVEPDLLARMKADGLSGVYLGIESGNEQGLQTFNKRYRVADVYRTVGVLKDLEVPFEFGFMMFEPYSTLASVRENIAFLTDISNDGDSLVHFCKMSPYAGTPIARRLAAEGRLGGTVACPDYRFLDRKLDLLQTIYSLTFNFRNFDERGLVERLRFAKFDALVVDTFFSRDRDARAYRDAVRTLIRSSNESALDTMRICAALVESHDVEQVLDHWPVVEEVCAQEKLAEEQMSVALDRLMIDFGFEAAAAGEARTTRWPPARSIAADVHATA